MSITKDQAMQNILNRLNQFGGFHPATANLFTDWTLEPGDIITVKSGETDYSVPVYQYDLDWKGGTIVAVQSTGSKKRPDPSKLNRGGGYGGNRREEEIDQEAVRYETRLGKTETTVYAYAGAMGIALDQDGNPLIDEYGKYVYDNEGNNSIFAQLELKPNKASLISEINSASGTIAAGRVEVQPGSVLIKAINGGGQHSSVTLEADIIDIAGLVTALKAWDLTVMDISATDIVVSGSIEGQLVGNVQGNLDGNVTGENHVGYFQSGLYVGSSLAPVGNGLADAQVVPSGSEYVFQIKRYGDSDWTNAGTFSRATTLVGVWSYGNPATDIASYAVNDETLTSIRMSQSMWLDNEMSVYVNEYINGTSGPLLTQWPAVSRKITSWNLTWNNSGTLTVTASPQNQSTTYSPPMALFGSTQNSSFSAAVYELQGSDRIPRKSVYGALSETVGTNAKGCYVDVTESGSTTSVARISTSATFNRGQSVGRSAGQNSVQIVKGTWSGGIIRFTKSVGTGTGQSVQLAAGTETWSGTEVSIPILDGSGSTGYTVKSDVSSKLTTATVAPGGTVTAGSGSYANYIGFTSVTASGSSASPLNIAPGTTEQTFSAGPYNPVKVYKLSNISGSRSITSNGTYSYDVMYEGADGDDHSTELTASVTVAVPIYTTPIQASFGTTYEAGVGDYTGYEGLKKVVVPAAPSGATPTGVTLGSKLTGATYNVSIAMSEGNPIGKTIDTSAITVGSVTGTAINQNTAKTSNIIVTATADNGNRGSGTLLMSTGTYEAPVGAAEETHNCVNLTLDNVTIGRADIDSYISPAETVTPSRLSQTISPGSGKIGIKSVTVSGIQVASSPVSEPPEGRTQMREFTQNGYYTVGEDGYVRVNFPSDITIQSLSAPVIGAAVTQTSTTVTATASNGATRTANLALSSGSFTPTNATGTHRCLNVLLGGNTVARADTQPIYEAGFSDGSSATGYTPVTLTLQGERVSVQTVRSGSAKKFKHFQQRQMYVKNSAGTYIPAQYDTTDWYYIDSAGDTYYGSETKYYYTEGNTVSNTYYTRASS